MAPPKRPRASPKAGDDADTAPSERGSKFLVDVNSTATTVSLLQGIEAKLHSARDEVHGLMLRQTDSESAAALLVRELVSVANQLLRQAAIVAKAADGTTTVFLLRELELYCHYPDVHPDSFTHCDVQQTLFGTWYFHKKGGTYKSGSFKGLDITAGFERPTKLVPGASADDSDDAPSSIPAIGFLIRSVQQLSERPGDALNPEGFRAFGFGPTLAAEGLVEGPSLTVDAILKATRCKTIASLVGSAGFLLLSSALGKTGAKPQESAPELYLVAVRAVDGGEGTVLSPKVLTAPRVGLIPRTVPHLTFAGRLYRYISSWPDNNKSRHLAKHRSGIVSGLATAELQRLSAEASLPESLSGQKRAAVLDALRENSGATKQNCEAILDLVTKSWNALIVGRKDVGIVCAPVLGEDVHKSEIIAPIVVAALSLSKIN